MTSHAPSQPPRNDPAPLGSAIVTGGTAGIGHAIACALHARGFGVWVTGRNVPEDRVLAEIGSRSAFVAVDHSSSSAGAATVAAVDDRFGPLRVLVNNAGRRHGATVSALDATEIRATLDLNVLGTMMMTQAVVPRLTAAGGGSIINMSSRLAVVGMPAVSAYSASKGAINGFTVATAIELAPAGIRVNAVAPGMTRTPLIDEWIAEQPDPVAAEQAQSALVPLGRLGTPQDVAAVVAFLASPEAEYLTGMILPVDGGYTAA
ncbi:SDR family NAD(P)-dependent oxidoreductase [Leucobacter sp. M11]|uniref:SDR family NAD(P)-dependent oxidoreductase n=1 Tax=Leucobacter sp. M11 TaxID=2993565 RepID=UPI002D7E1F9E|nr:SDR family oxidoreductase [Leucobacter sp. M11]MEB4616418.1 SDR family NAD(P)-dependent oxidoreductase [Leucobacter sp. M11]